MGSKAVAGIAIASVDHQVAISSNIPAASQASLPISPGAGSSTVASSSNGPSTSPISRTAGRPGLSAPGSGKDMVDPC